MAGEIFISYRRADEARARLLYDKLKAEGVEAWYDAHVGAGEDWRKATATALDRSKIFVLLFSKAASESEDIAKELAAATFSKKLVVPVRIENIQPTGSFLYELASRNWIDAYHDTDAKLGELAKNLAAVVKRGEAVPELPSGRAAPQAKPPGRIGLMAAGGALVLAVVVGLGAFLLKPTPVKVNERFAFFGFDSAAELGQVASVANDTFFRTMTSERMDVVAREETIGTDAGKRLEKAAALGAQYALTGEIHQVEGGKLQASMQLLDVPSKVSLWPSNVDAPANNQTLLADRISYQAIPVAKCTGVFRMTLARDDREIVRDLPKACESITLFNPADLSVWRRIAAKAQESALIQSSFISMLGTSRRPGADIARLTEEAKAAFARVEAVAPESVEAYRARIAMLMWDAPRYQEAEAVADEARKRWPDDSWLNYSYAALLRGVGRIRDSVPAIQNSTNGDPLSPLKQTYLARTMAATGAFPVEGRKVLERVLNVSQFYIAWYVLYGVLPLDSEDGIDAILAAAPPTVPLDQIDCARTAAATARRLARTAGQKRNVDLGCKIDNIIRPDVAFGLLSYAGDVDAAYELPALINLPVGENIYLFLPSTRAARMDERFEELATKLGLMDYWTKTGHLPDFCETEQAPVCVKLKAAVPK